MQIYHTSGTVVALLFLTANIFVTAQLGKTATNKRVEADTKTTSSHQTGEPIKIEIKKQMSGETAKPTNMKKDTSNEKEKYTAQEIKTTDSKERIQKSSSPTVTKQVSEGTAKATKTTFKPSRILVMMPMPFYSHTQNCMPIFKELARKGHHLTVVSPFPQNLSMPNWEEIIVPNNLEEIMSYIPNPDMTKKLSFSQKIFGFVGFSEKCVNLTLHVKPLIDFYEDDSRKFDLIFVEAQMFQEPLLAFGHKFKAPVISVFPGFITPEVAYYSGNPVMTTTYVPNMYFPFSNSMSFVERGINTAYNLLRLLVYNLWTIPRLDQLMHQYLPSKDLPYLGDMMFNISFTFLNSHHVLSYPYPRVNNIRGYLGVASKPTTELSEDLQEYLDSGDDGVLFFTLGSHFQPSLLKPHVLEALISAFARLPNKVLMKWDKDEPPAGLPPNVKTKKWFPQSAVLAHKNCMAFVSHTGVHGLVESLDHGVPVISVPLFADQHFFSKWVQEKGVGLSIDIDTVTPEFAYQTIKEVISDKKYKENAVEISKLMKDVPQPTMDELIYWTEYVIRTKGAPLLRSGVSNLAWYQRFGLDLLAVAVTIVVVPSWIMFAILKCFLRMCRNLKKTKTSSSVNNKSRKAKKRD